MVPFFRVTSRIRVPGDVTLPRLSSTCAVPDESHVNLMPDTCANRPSMLSTCETAFSKISFSCDAGIFGTIASKFGNGTISNVSSSVIPPAGITLSFRIAPPLIMARSGEGVPKLAASLLASENTLSATRFPSFVSTVRTSL